MARSAMRRDDKILVVSVLRGETSGDRPRRPGSMPARADVAGALTASLPGLLGYHTLFGRAAATRDLALRLSSPRTGPRRWAPGHAPTLAARAAANRQTNAMLISRSVITQVALSRSVSVDRP